jgi:hypothetical protein
MRGAGRDLLILVSLVNLAYLRVWTELLTLRSSDLFLLEKPYGPGDYVAAVCGVALIAAALWGLALFSRFCGGKWMRRARYLGFVLLALVPLSSIRNLLMAHYPQVSIFVGPQLLARLRAPLIRVPALALAGVFCIALVRYRAVVVRAIAWMFILVAPLAAFTFAESLWMALGTRRSFPPGKALGGYLAHAKASPRVLWILSDEWDYRLTFVDRPPGLSLPALDRLSREVFFAENAVSPGWATILSVPAYIDGAHVRHSTPVGIDKLALDFAGSRPAEDWGTRPNIFSEARAGGFNTGIVGWYLPYCSVFAPDLSSCSTMPMETLASTMRGGPFFRNMMNQARSVVETGVLSPFGQSLCGQARVRNYPILMGRLRSMAADPRLGLIFVHLPITHAPFVYDRRTGAFTLANHPFTGYWDSLALLDRTVADLRSFLEARGQWDRTTILLSTDHPYRSANILTGRLDPRIPFLLKFAGEKQGLRYPRLFNTVLTSQLLLAVLRGEVKDANDAAAWLDRHPDTDVAQPSKVRDAGE